MNKPAHILNCAGKLLDLSSPQIMGVLNVTPDSFSDGGQLHQSGQLSLDKALARAEQMCDQGAALIDIGGESTRPGAAPVSLQQEMDRVLPIVEAIHSRLDTIISVDSSSPELILEAAAKGAGFINDVRALTHPGALKAVAATGLPVCLMHMQGEPDSMQNKPDYHSVVDEVVDFLMARVEAASHLGLAKRNIVLDPGFGFGKSTEHNLSLLNRLDTLAERGFPVLVGLSRKSLIGKVLGRDVDQRLAGSLALAMMAISRGAAIIRVHDVAETSDSLKLYAAVTHCGLE
jgi:dihydropteroate synthase